MANVKPDTAPDAVFAGWLGPIRTAAAARRSPHRPRRPRRAECPAPAPAPGRRGSQPPGQRGLGDTNGADRARRPLQCVHQGAGLGRSGGQGGGELARLAREHAEHLALEASVTKRHSPQMVQIDRTGVIGGRGMASIRSVMDPAISEPDIGQRQADTAICRKPTTAAVKEHLVYAPHLRPLLAKKSTQLTPVRG